MNEQELLLKAAEAFDSGNMAAGMDFLNAAREFRDLSADVVNTQTPEPVGPTVQDVSPQSPTVGEITLEQALSAAKDVDSQNVSAQSNVTTLPGIGTITRVPGAGGSVFQQFGQSDILGQATGTDGNEQIRNLFGSFDNLLNSFNTQRLEAEDQLSRTRAGEFDDRFSNPAFQNVRVANTPAEAQRIREEGFIPIASRDAELIRQIGLEQAEQIRADAEQALAIRQGEERSSRLQQVGSGLGNAIASGLTGTNVGQAQNARLTGLADQARQSILQGVENRRAANAQAGQIDARSRIDEMLANTEAVRELQNLMIQDATNSFRLRFDEESRLQNRIQEIEDNRLRLEANRPAFLSQLVQLASANQRRGNAQFVQDRAVNQRSLQLQNANQLAVTTAARVAQNAKAIADRAVESRGLFTNLDEQLADAEIQRLLISVQELNELSGELEQKGLLAPEVARIREQVINQVQPLISQLGTSGIITEEGVRVEANDRDAGLSKSFGQIGEETQKGINDLVQSLGGISAPPASLISGQNNGTLNVNASSSERSDALVSQLF